MTQRIIELCLEADSDVMPFAVLVEQDGRCVWATAPATGGDTGWDGHVLSGKERRATEWWVLRAWREWLAEVANEAPEQRLSALKRMEGKTPGVIVRTPTAPPMRLPLGALAQWWARHRLHDPAESVAAAVAQRLAVGGKAHWSSQVLIEGHEPLRGDWIVEREPAPGRRIGLFAEGNPSDVPEFARSPITDSTTTVASGLAVIRVIEAPQVPEIKYEWAAARRRLAAHYPYGVAIVRRAETVEVLDSGCLIGDQFPAPVSLTVAVVRSCWLGPLGGSSYSSAGASQAD